MVRGGGITKEEGRKGMSCDEEGREKKNERRKRNDILFSTFQFPHLRLRDRYYAHVTPSPSN